jgi:[ribosomal protein S5]-alanine N-acetyltransferase
MTDPRPAMMTPVPRSIPLPEPPLVDGVVRLRPWGGAAVRGDAEALVAAWSDPDIQRWSAVPAPHLRTIDHAARWIRHEADRRRTGLAIDLVIAPVDDEPTGLVLGEVGLAPIDWETMEANVGWWVSPEARGRGVATRAVTLLARWARTELGLSAVAVVDPANRASMRVAERAGVELRGCPDPGGPAGRVPP